MHYSSSSACKAAKFFSQITYGVICTYMLAKENMMQGQWLDTEEVKGTAGEWINIHRLPLNLARVWCAVTLHNISITVTCATCFSVACTQQHCNCFHKSKNFLMSARRMHLQECENTPHLYARAGFFTNRHVYFGKFPFPCRALLPRSLDTAAAEYHIILYNHIFSVETSKMW